MYSNTEEQGSKKKYLVPVIALLICGMAFVGSAYAYSSSIETSSNLETQYYEITLDGKDTYTFTDKLAFDAVKVDGKVTYTAKDISKDVVVAMAENNGTKAFSITSTTVVIKTAAGADVSGLKGELKEVSIDEDGNHLMKLTISGKLADNVVPEKTYKVTITVNTDANNA